MAMPVLERSRFCPSGRNQRKLPTPSSRPSHEKRLGKNVSGLAWACLLIKQRLPGPSPCLSLSLLGPAHIGAARRSKAQTIREAA